MHLEQKLKFDLLQPREWESLKHVEELLSLFADFTEITGGESYATISRVIPCIVKLRNHLEGMLMVDDVSVVACIMLDEVNRRFDYVINPAHAKFNPVYMVAMLLDPRFSKVHDHLGTTTMAQQLCVTFIKKGADASSDENVQADQQSDENVDTIDPDGDLSLEMSEDATGEPPRKRRKKHGLAFVKTKLKKNVREQIAAK